MSILSEPLLALLELAYPERCVVCARGRAECAWSANGPLVRGLRRWDRPHLCSRCEADLDRTAVRSACRLSDGGTAPVVAMRQTDADLVRIVGCWKYHGVRGLAWPLARTMVTVARTVLYEMSVARRECRPQLVPVPLHGRRRRARGFNQSELLALLLAKETGLVVANDLLRRTRSTAQQARLREESDRRMNLADAFVCGRDRRADDGAVVLVDDLVTSGATAAAAASALRARDWPVAGVLALGAVEREAAGGDEKPLPGPGPGAAG